MASKEIVELRTHIEQMRPQFEAVLPPHIAPDRFMRVVMTAAQLQPSLAKAERSSLLGACMKAAQDGLLPDGREAAFVLFWDNKANVQRAQYMPMVAGVLKKVRNSGELASISANVVYAKDEFLYQLGDDEKIIHVPYTGEDRGPPVRVYAVATLRSGEKVREVMTTAEIEQVRAVSKAKDKGPWVEWWGEMARKTVIRRLSKRLPMSSDLDTVIRRDDDLYDLNARPARGPTRAAQVLNLLTGAEAAPDKGEPEPETEPEPAPARRGRPRKAGTNVKSGEQIDPETGEILPPDGDLDQDQLPL